jgi:hypothetical protein
LHACELLLDLVPADRLWVVASDPIPTEAARTIVPPLDRGTLPATLLALIDVVVERPGALVVLATSRCSAVPPQHVLEAVGAAFLETLLDKARPIVIGDGEDVGVIVAHAENLLRAFARALPRLTRLFTYAALMRPSERERFLRETFQGLPRLDLSRDLLRGSWSPGPRPTRHAVTGCHARSGHRQPGNVILSGLSCAGVSGR